MQQFVCINLVRLNPTCPAIDLYARWVDDVIAHAILLQEMQPEPVIAGLIAANDLDCLLQLSANTGADLIDELKQTLPVAACQCVTADFLCKWCIDCDNPDPMQR